jgi:hypothetical protein
VSHEKLKEALVNWQAQKAYYEKELSITSHAPQKFELEKQIQICDQQIKRLTEENLVAPPKKEVTHKKGCLFLAINVVIMGVVVSITVFSITISNDPSTWLPHLNENLTRTIKVDLAVTDIETNQPISHIEVYFLSKGSRTIKMTDDNGYTSIEIPERGDIQVTLRKFGYKTKTFTINLETDKNRTRSEYMEKESFKQDAGKVPDVQLAPSNSSSKPNPNTHSSTNRIISESPRANPERIGELEGSKLFEHSISANLPEQTYHFKLANTSDVSLYLDGVSSEAQIVLNKANQAGVITSYMTMKSASNAKSGVIKEKLETGDYVVVVKLISRETKYFLRLFNNTNLAENVDYLETEKKYTNQTISSQYPEKHYHFKLANPTNVSLRLEGVNSDTQIFLNKADEAGVIRSYITMSSASKAKSGVIQEKLETGDYVVVIRFQARETNYNLTMSAQ